MSLRRFLPWRRFKRRYEVINHLVRTRQFRDYLEIGVSTGKCMRRVECERRSGVDPNPRIEPTGWTLHEKTSDEFFSENTERFDIVFVDGLHLAEQAFIDTINAVAVLKPNGVVLVHDTHPPTERAQLRDLSLEQYGGWNGDVWKSIAYIRRHMPDLFCRVLDLDWGIGIVAPLDHDRATARPTEMKDDVEQFVSRTSWQDLANDRAGTLGLIPNKRSLERELASSGVCRRVR